ncbi:PREDICTED: olfactory receptor 14I1-like [Chrysochloris asiatica]|uniref:Olfactory receptor 14I1-like n=1 Tax=Chrysochloris asiatica TaxID=185453 RepID=A0A9B0U354_CHRAS|nr:PREDICTED: olfactory receptor 14I1-like [Chrysochloris asiatica]
MKFKMILRSNSEPSIIFVIDILFKAFVYRRTFIAILIPNHMKKITSSCGMVKLRRLTFLTCNNYNCIFENFETSIGMKEIEIAFLVVMSYDRYIAICHPLHYGLTVTPQVCVQAAGGSWASGLLYSAIHTVTMFRLPFTKSNVIYQYFCDVPQILRITSSDVQFSESVLLAVSSGIILACFAFLFMSYIKIFSSVLQIRSVEARNKALSTCTPQLAILFLFVISALIAVLGPTANKASLKNLLTAMFYTMLPPLINPLIYSLRNREINFALGRMYKNTPL